jgi:hypothetical protein
MHEIIGEKFVNHQAEGLSTDFIGEKRSYNWLIMHKSYVLQKNIDIYKVIKNKQESITYMPLQFTQSIYINDQNNIIVVDSI